MKANRKFVQADEAVSPVIAVILMVAITVVLAATVFVLVSDIGGNTANSAPSISWTADEGNDRLTVSTAAQNADWNRLTVQLDSCTSTGSAIAFVGQDTATPDIYINEAADDDATTGDHDLNSAPSATTCSPLSVEITGVATKISAGDYIEFCVAPGTMANAKVTIKDTTANAVVHTYTFTTIDPC
jgi:flagellin-like protein